jgi:hypothetical protein
MMWWTDYTASLIAPITDILRREEFHDDGDSSSNATINVIYRSNSLYVYTLAKALEIQS